MKDTNQTSPRSETLIAEPATVLTIRGVSCFELIKCDPEDRTLRFVCTNPDIIRLFSPPQKDAFPQPREQTEDERDAIYQERFSYWEKCVQFWRNETGAKFEGAKELARFIQGMVESAAAERRKEQAEPLKPNTLENALSDADIATDSERFFRLLDSLRTRLKK
jgi:hypothetical protein